MSLSLVAGPANAGKVALLLERYLARLDDEPTLIVPNRSDVDRVERDLLARCGCLLGGSIGTFDDLFERLVADDPAAGALATDAQRALVVAPRGRGGALERARRAPRARAASPTRSLSTLGELESGLLDPGDLDGELAALHAPTAPSSTASVSGTATCCAAARPSAWPASSTPGTATRCSRTGSRI